MTLQINEVHSLQAPMQRLPETGALFQFERPVRTADVDEDKRLRLDGVARYLQDIGSDNAAAMGEEVVGPLWIVRRTVIDVVRPILWPTRVHLQRWCSAMSNRWATMRVDIESEDGGLIETEAFWINISEDTGMPTRVSEELERNLMNRTTEHRLRWRPLLKEAAPDLDGTPFPLRFTDIDPMRHLNNTVYLHVIEDLLSADGQRAEPHRVVIEYLRPITRDASVSIRHRRDDDGLAVWFLVDGVDHARAWVLAL